MSRLVECPEGIFIIIIIMINIIFDKCVKCHIMPFEMLIRFFTAKPVHFT